MDRYGVATYGRRGRLVVDEDDKYRYCPPWANAEITDDDTWFGRDAECRRWSSLVEWLEWWTEDEAADGD